MGLLPFVKYVVRWPLGFQKRRKSQATVAPEASLELQNVVNLRVRRPLGLQKLPLAFKDSQKLPEAFRIPKGRAPRSFKGSQGFPEAPNGSQRSHGLPEAPERLSETPKDSHKFPGAPKCSQGFLEAHRDSQKLPEAPKSCQKLPKVPRGYQGLTRIPRKLVMHGLSEASRGS